MKRVLLIFGILFLVVVIGLSLFLATFNADRYRSVVVQQLSEAFHTPVAIERLSLTWKGGIAAQLQGVVIGDPASPEMSLKTDSVFVLVRLLPLLKKQIQISTVTIVRPQLWLTRQADNILRIGGLPSVATPPASSSEPTQPPPPAAAMSLLIASLAVEQGTVRLRDATQQPPLELALEQLDLTVQNFSLTSPIKFRVRVACWSRQQNIQASGRIQLPSGAQGGYAEALKASTDLAQLDIDALASSFPQAVFRETPRGKLQIAIDRLPFTPQALDELVAQIQLTDGRLAMAALANPIDRITAELTARKNTIDLQQFSASIGGGTLSGKAQINYLNTQPQARLDVTMQDVSLQHVLPMTNPQEPSLQGVLSTSFQGTAIGTTWPALVNSLSGTGRTTISDLKILNLNVLREVFQRLSILPGLVQALQSRLPEDYQEKFQARDTVFQPMDVTMTTAQGRVQLHPLQLLSETFQLDGSGSVRLADGAFEGRLWLRVDVPLSAAIIQSVNELQVLTNANGELELPVVARTQPRVSVLPDIQYVASKILIPKAQDILANVLQKAFQKNEESTP